MQHATRIGLGLTALLLLAAGCQPGSPPPPDNLSAQWEDTGGGWGKITITGNKGTYTDTFGTGPGTFEFQKQPDGSYAGTWGESEKRHGTLSFTVSDAGRTIKGTYKADEDCEIGPGDTGDIHWTRK